MYIELICIKGVFTLEKEISKSDWLFLLLCLLLGILAEQSFFINSEIGISFLVFIAAFYGIFFWRYRGFSFSHQRIGYLMLICIWLLAASYFTHKTLPFDIVNILVIPGLVFFHIVLITSPKKMNWNRIRFIGYLFAKIIAAIKYDALFAAQFGKSADEETKRSYFSIVKKVLAGALITVPVLVIVIPLLISADNKFKELIGDFPRWFSINPETIAKVIFVLLSAAAFFGVFQILSKRHVKEMEMETVKHLFQIDGVITFSFLAVMNFVYIIFTFVQFKYFFGGYLQSDLTYAEYARKGFFELMFVTVMNLTLTVIVLLFANRTQTLLCRLNQTMLTILVLSSTVMLCSAFKRLGMYEEAYGYSFSRILAHSFMIFLTVIFAYTLIKIWIEKLSLFHFYFISALVYYVVINTIDLEQLAVNKNIERYQLTGKLDVHYLDSLSYSGTLGLISLYEKDKNIPDLNVILQERRAQAQLEKSSWQSFNLKREQAKRELEMLKLN
jgi:hypothetical protein